MNEFRTKLESLDSETREVTEHKAELENREVKIESALAELENDPELYELMNVSMIDLTRRQTEIECRISEYKTYAQETGIKLQEAIDQTIDDTELFREFEEYGEDVSEAVSIIEDRKKFLDECREKLNEILDRLEVSRIECEVLKEIRGEKLLKELNENYYDKALETAKHSNLKFFKAHLEGHIKLVISRSIEAAYIISRISGVKISMKDTALASLYHDTGMDGRTGKSMRYSSDDGDGIRSNHSMTSALHVLEDRAKIESLGGNADKIAAMVYLHSKSGSGVGVFNTRGNAKLKAALERIRDEAVSYGLEFNPDNTGSMLQFQCEAAALRIGDACGHDANSKLTQSGGTIEVNYNVRKYLTAEWENMKYLEEAKNADVVYISPSGKRIIIDDSNDSPDKRYTRMFQTGEGNISSMHVRYASDNELEFVVDIKNAGDAPLCTMECIKERLGELRSAKRLFAYRTVINLNGHCDERIKRLYDSFSEKNRSAYGDICIKTQTEGEKI